MDGQRFDKLTRAFASGMHRRSLLKAAGGASVIAIADTKLAAQKGVSAQECVPDSSPGGCCFTDADCAGLFCVIQGDPGAAGICACTESGIGEPWLGCGCISGSLDACGDSDLTCCSDYELPGGSGTCLAECPATGDCADPGESCEESGCCTVGECGANGYCTACYSGTEAPCGDLNELFGADFICCVAPGSADGAVGYCTEESLCVTDTPNTGAGSTADSSTWIAPAAAVGAAAAVLAYRSRVTKADVEA